MLISLRSTVLGHAFAEEAHWPKNQHDSNHDSAAAAASSASSSAVVFLGGLPPAMML